MTFKASQLVDFFFRYGRRHSEKKCKGILLISSGGLGDTILFSLMMPYFQQLIAHDESITLVTQSGRDACRFLFPNDITWLTVNYRRFIKNLSYRWRVSWYLRQQRFRIAITTDHLRLPLVDEAMLISTAAPKLYGLEARSWPKHDHLLQKNRCFYTKLIPVSEGRAHRMIRWCELTDGLLGKVITPPVVRFRSEQLPCADVSIQPTVVIHPFSAIKERQFSPEFYLDLMKSIPEEYAIVISAGPNDWQVSPEFQRLLEDKRVTANNKPIMDKAALFQSAELVIAVDTSMMHLAVGVGAKTICIASAAHLVDSVPYDKRITPDNVTFFYHSMPCEGCLGQCDQELIDKRYPCVTFLKTALIHEKIAEICKSQVCCA